MALVLADRVRESTTTSGTTLAVVLNGAVTAFRRLASAVSVGDTLPYLIQHTTRPSQWEVGVGTLTDETTLERTTVLASSNSDALVDFSAGVKQVSLSVNASLMAQALAPLTADDVPGLPASKITSGVFDIAHIPGIPTENLVGTLTLAQLPTISFGDLTGTASDAQIPSLAASKIGSGTFDEARIPGLNASKITAGDIAQARISTALAAGGVPLAGTTGSFSADVVIGAIVGTPPSGTPRATIYGAASSNALVVRTNAAAPLDILALQRSDGSNMFSFAPSGLMRFGPTLSTWPALKAFNGGTSAPRFQMRTADDSAYVLFSSGGAEMAYDTVMTASAAFGNTALNAYRVMINKNDTALIQTHSGGVYAWGSTTGNQFSQAVDTGLSRLSAGRVGVGNGSAANVSGTLILASIGPGHLSGATLTSLVDINSDTLRIRTAKTPASASAAGNQGDIAWDSNFIYVAVGSNSWKRAALSAW